MAYITWKDSFEVGIPEIDADHRVITGLIHELHVHLVVTERPREGRMILLQLIDRIEEHFNRENALLRRTDPHFAGIHADHYRNVMDELRAAHDSLDDYVRNATLDLLVRQIRDLFILTITRFCCRLKAEGATVS